MRTKGSSQYGKKGQMPMALIAVSLLMAGAFYGIVYADIEKGTENAESTIAEFSSIDDEIERARITIESALGEIVTDISRADGGTLLNRSDEFRHLSEEMFASKFPSVCRGVRTEITDTDVKLGMKNMRLTESEILGGATSASYLTASGTVDLVFTSESSVAHKKLEISADATSALPLLAEASTRFELSTKGSGTALSQMVEYQLSALASQRVLNGYGTFSAGGQFGTSGIITTADVGKAVRNGLNILETMFFRDSGDTGLLFHTYADLADMICLEDGCLCIDMGSLYAQALLQKADQYAIQWIEYIGADWIIDLLDTVYDGVRKMFEWVCNKIDRDHTKNEMIDYIKDQMSNLGYSQSEYRYFRAPGSLTVTLGDICYTDKGDDEDIVHVIPGDTYELDYPEVDILDWDGWGRFMENYRSQVNEVREMVNGAIKAIATNAIGGTVLRIPVSSFDGETFEEEMSQSIRKGVESSMEGFIDASAKTVRTCRITDPIMAEVYHTICENSDEIFRVNEVEEQFERLASILSFKERGIIGYFEIRDLIRPQIDSSAYIAQYREIVSERLQYLDIMNDATKKQSLSQGLASTVGYFLRNLDLEQYVKDTAVSLCDQMMDWICINPYSKVTELPGTDRFVLSDGNGNICSEKLSVTDCTDLNIEVVDPRHNSGKNVHYIGIFQDRVGKYSSVFTVRISGSIGYTVKGCTPIFETLGLFDSAYSAAIPVEIELDIAVPSAAPLAGTDYSKSNTVYGDASRLIEEFISGMIDSLFGPLKDIMSSLEGLMNVAGSVIIEFGNQLNRMMEMYYRIISVPMDLLQDIVDGIVQDLICKVGIEDLCIKLGSQTLVLNLFGITVTIRTDIRSLEKTSKEYFTITAEKYVGKGTTVRASVSLRENARAGHYLLFTGGAEGGDWKLSLSLDPMLSSGSYYATVNGRIRNIEYSGNLPELVQYQTFDFSTADIPAVGELLSNIPLPAIGYKGNLELGVSVKYGSPVQTGLLINEVELNPEGDDSGKEWIELYNNTDSPINVLGYTVSPSDSDKKAVSLDRIVIPAHGREVVSFKGQVLNNSGGSSSKSGIRLSLYDTYGNLVDRTPAMKDGENNGSTWQRTSDGSVKWSFMPGTPGERNSGSVPGYALKSALIDFAKDAAVEILDEMGDEVNGTDEFIEYAERVMARVIEKFIDSISGSLIEACAYVRFELTDYVQTQHFGIKVSVGVDSDIINDTLRYIASMIPTIGDYIAFPEGLGAEGILSKDVYLRILTYAGMSMPKILRGADIAETDAGISVRTNISGIRSLFGGADGDWYAEAGIVLEDVPSAALPATLKADKSMKSDLWLIKMRFREVCN